MIENGYVSYGVIRCNQCNEMIASTTLKDIKKAKENFSENRVFLKVIMVDHDSLKVNHFCCGECLHEFLKKEGIKNIAEIELVVPYIENVANWLGKPWEEEFMISSKEYKYKENKYGSNRN